MFAPWPGLYQTKLRPSSENRCPHYSAQAVQEEGGLLIYVHLVGLTASLGRTLICSWCNDGGGRLRGQFVMVCIRAVLHAVGRSLGGHVSRRGRINECTGIQDALAGHVGCRLLHGEGHGRRNGLSLIR